MNYGQIIITNHYNDDDFHTYSHRTYKWEGSPIARVSTFFIPQDHVENDSFWIGQYLVKVITFDVIRGEYIVQKLNGKFSERLVSLEILFIRWLKLINIRILQTLNIWNLMDTNYGCYPIWKDLKILRKFRK